MRGRNHHHITTNMTNRWPYQLAYNNPDVSEFHTEIVAQKKAVVHEFFLLRHKNYFLALLAVARIIQSSAQQTQREIDMWFDQETDSAGYADMISDIVFAEVVVAIVATVAAMVWAYKGAF